MRKCAFSLQGQGKWALVPQQKEEARISVEISPGNLEALLIQGPAATAGATDKESEGRGHPSYSLAEICKEKSPNRGLSWTKNRDHLARAHVHTHTHTPDQSE